MPDDEARDSSLSSRWQPGPRPDWVRMLNALANPAWISLEPESLLDEARRNTGLEDFGSDDFREPMDIFLAAIEDEAQLNTVGRLLARSDVLNLLENRLRMYETRKRNPEIGQERIEKPIFITGLPRTGTSILHEVLGQDPGSRVPLAWEARHPCPPPQRASYESDPRIARADDELRFWDEVVPEFKTMHELGARVPVECIVLTAHAFRSDELSGRHGVPSYAGWLTQADLRPAYDCHREMLQLLQWRAPGERWVLKAPSHMTALDTLFAVYPDARVIQTHRDPLTVMASVASILFGTAWVRSDAVDAESILSWFGGETCALILEGAMALRDSGRVDPRQFCDVRYADFTGDPIATVARIYQRFEIPFGAETEARMSAYLQAKPKGKHGAHDYSFADTGFDRERERQRFAAYQERYGVPSEV